MAALSSNLACIRPVLQKKVGLYVLTQAEQMKWTSVLCRLCSTVKDVDQQSSGQERVHFQARPQHRLTTFQKRLLTTSGKYPSIAACPDSVGQMELRSATDMCKTMFNIWCMMFLGFFWTFLHFMERRRMKREHARIDRQQARTMREMDKVNQEMVAKGKLAA